MQPNIHTYIQKAQSTTKGPLNWTTIIAVSQFTNKMCIILHHNIHIAHHHPRS